MITDPWFYACVVAAVLNVGIAKGARRRHAFWSTLAGFTSVSIHAGGPPAQAYLLSQRLDKSLFQATTVGFFFILNWMKLPGRLSHAPSRNSRNGV